MDGDGENRSARSCRRPIVSSNLEVFDDLLMVAAPQAEKTVSVTFTGWMGIRVSGHFDLQRLQGR